MNGTRADSGPAGLHCTLKTFPALPVIALIRLYQMLVSPLLGTSCKYHPSCSEYAVEALRRHGFAKGSVLAGWRLLRCNPWSHGGVDKVEDQRLFA